MKKLNNRDLIIVLFSSLLVFVGCGSGDYYTVQDYATVQKADVHVHIRTDRDVFASQAEKDQFKLVNIVVDGASTWDGIRDQFRFAKMQQQARPDQFRTISAFSVEDFHTLGWSERSIAWMDSCFQDGAIGIKVWKNIGMVLKDTNGSNVMLHDARLDPVFDFIVQQDKILFAHQGEPYNCWLPLAEMTTNNDRNYFTEHPQYHMYKHPELPSYQALMDARDLRMDKHPDLRFVGAHMASIEWNVDTLAAWLDQYPEATIDLAARMGQVFYQAQEDPERVRDFFLKYQDRVMYATDAGDNGSRDPNDLAQGLHETWLRDWTFFVTDDAMESDLIEGGFQGIKLPKTAVDKIFYGTGKRVFGF
ncbi:MAG: amidohydrolase family protein [Saprospiraceae bacterium]|nr:amidohydrolase family protein [Saprospiraceae bacterium]